MTFIVAIGVVTRVYLFFVGMRGGGLVNGDIQMLNHDDLQKNETSSSFWGAWRKKKDSTLPEYVLAKADSYGFFNAIDDDTWIDMKQETRTIIDLQGGVMLRTSYLLSEGGANIDSSVWWNDNWKINFTCQNKASIGGKLWLCDPGRILSFAEEKAEPNTNKGWRKKSKNQLSECLIYISGGNEVEIANQFLDYSVARAELHSGEDSSPLPCEVHIFTPNKEEVPRLKKLINKVGKSDQREGLFFHQWGFRPSNKPSMGLAADSTVKTLADTVAELQHSGRISVLSLDCEACEWDIFRDILNLEEPIQQVNMQMHGTPYMANELFLAMQEAGYVIFHREAEINGGGEVYDYSWLKLSPSYFVPHV